MTEEATKEIKIDVAGRDTKTRPKVPGKTQRVGQFVVFTIKKS